MRFDILQGDCVSVLRTLPEDSVDCCVTSPPYWGLRNYGCDGQLGLEASPDKFVAKLVEVFSEVRRVLRGDGTLWLNLGDCYATGAGKVGDHPGGGAQGEKWKGFRGDHPVDPKRNSAAIPMGPTTQPNRMPIPGLKPKDLVGIPWKVAFALQADGWWLRSDIIWSKPNPMPESVKDRPTKAHEYLFLLTKSESYYYDAASVAEPAVETSLKKFTDNSADKQRGHGRRHAGFNGRYADKLAKDGVPTTRNRRSVWSIATSPTPEAHFATFPIQLPEICLKAGSAEGGTVLDPFAGAGTTGLACIKNGRNFLGIELNPAYIEIARARAKKHYSLFIEELPA